MNLTNTDSTAQPSSTSTARPTILYCVTVSLSASTLLRGQLAYFSRKGYRVHLACSPGPTLQDLAARESVTVHPIPMSRRISPLRDMLSLFAMIALIRNVRPDIINAGTPKAGLLGILAATLTGVRARVYVMRGLRLQTSTGLMRKILILTEKLACRCAHVVVCVSPSLREEAIRARLVSPNKAQVIGMGSSNGVDVERFKLDAHLREQIDSLRAKHHLSTEAPTLGFVGRLTKDKGVIELIEAFERLYAEDSSIRLLLVGDTEDEDPLPQHTLQTIFNHPGIVRTGFVSETAPYYYLMDVLCLPSHREGFPNAPLEAAAAGRPTVTTDATGARDSVDDGVTGFVVRCKDIDSLTKALRRLLFDRQVARAMGEQARRRVINSFTPETVWKGLDDLYRRLLEQ